MKRIFLSAILIVGFTFCVLGQDVEVSNGSMNPKASAKKVNRKSDPNANNEKVYEKLKKLEDQVAAMRAEFEELKNLLKDKLKSDANDTKLAANATPKSERILKGDSAAIVNSTSTKSSKKDLGVDVGDYRVTPYGIIFFNAFANSNGTNNTDDPLWATANQSGNSGASGRQTRLGVRITGGTIGNAKVSGVVEADFYGGFPGVGVGENMGVLRLRVAKAQLDWEKNFAHHRARLDALCAE